MDGGLATPWWRHPQTHARVVKPLAEDAQRFTPVARLFQDLVTRTETQKGPSAHWKESRSRTFAPQTRRQ